MISTGVVAIMYLNLLLGWKWYWLKTLIQRFLYYLIIPASRFKGSERGSFKESLEMRGINCYFYLQWPGLLYMYYKMNLQYMPF